MKKLVLDISYIVSGGGKKYALQFINQLKDDYNLTVLSNNIFVRKIRSSLKDCILVQSK